MSILVGLINEINKIKKKIFKRSKFNNYKNNININRSKNKIILIYINKINNKINKIK